MFFFSRITGYELLFVRTLPVAASVNTKQRVILVLVSLFQGVYDIRINQNLSKNVLTTSLTRVRHNIETSQLNFSTGAEPKTPFVKFYSQQRCQLTKRDTIFSVNLLPGKNDMQNILNKDVHQINFTTFSHGSILTRNQRNRTKEQRQFVKLGSVHNFVNCCVTTTTDPVIFIHTIYICTIRSTIFIYISLALLYHDHQERENSICNTLKKV